MSVNGRHTVIRALRILATKKNTPPNLRMKAVEYLIQFEQLEATGKTKKTDATDKKLEELLIAAGEIG
jgi:hypothetical protein